MCKNCNIVHIFPEDLKNHVYERSPCIYIQLRILLTRTHKFFLFATDRDFENGNEEGYNYISNIPFFPFLLCILHCGFL